MVNGGLRCATPLKEGGELRSWMIVSAATRVALDAALSSGASALLLRLGGEKDARASAVALIEEARMSPRAPAIYTEVARVGDAALDADLDAIVAAAPAGVFLCSCESRADIQQLSVRLAVREAEAALAEGAVRIVAWAAQTPAGVLGLGGLATASPRLAALAFDAEALSAALDVPVDSPTILSARAQLVIAAAAAGVPALTLAPDGDAGAACAQARRAGFRGMLVRTPDQIPVVETVFGPAE